MNIGFSIDQHDKDGDKFDDCLLLHFNDTFLLRLADVKELDEVIKNLQDIRTEVVDNYGWRYGLVKADQSKIKT